MCIEFGLHYYVKLHKVKVANAYQVELPSHSHKCEVMEIGLNN